MGSDFSYADLTSRDLDQYDYTLMKETEVGGVGVWQIESIPRTKQEIKETGYTKSIHLRASGQLRRDPFRGLAQEGRSTQVHGDQGSRADRLASGSAPRST